ncbi:MAG: N-acetylneuraminate synthase family protein [Planctomycetota bacterium]
MRIGDREIGLDHPPYVIAEIGVNHDGEVDRALELTDAAADAGADAVKLQYFETDRLMSRAAKLAAYQKAAGETDPISMLRRLELNLDEMSQVVDRAHERGIHAIVTVFSTELVDAAETLAWDAYKTASPDIVNKPLLDRLCDTGKPMIVSTGASTLDEVVRAVGWLESVRDRLVVLQCVSSYPTPDEQASYGGIQAICEATDLPVGYSDHTRSEYTSERAVYCGAVLLEKHFTWRKKAAGPDHAASLEADEFKIYTNAAKSITSRVHSPKWQLEQEKNGPIVMDVEIGGICKVVLDCERDVRDVSRQSVVGIGAVPAGTVIGREHLTIKRPGTGILAYRLEDVIGRTAARDIEGDVPIVEEDVIGGLA